MDLLFKKLNDVPEAALVQALDAHMTCEVYGNTGHSGNSCLETRPKDANFIASTGIILNQGGIHDQISLSLDMEKTPEPEDKVADENTPGKEERPTSKHLPHEFYDTTVLPFPPRNKKAAADEQYSKFVVVIKKLYVNIPLLDAMQVPTYAKYLKDILNNKKHLPSTEIVHLTEECSAAILKKKDPASPTISCSIGT
ncbi:hypothetical protein U9M48_027224 [Paspalum notatum var. saurae]|uniref:Uncharacterized protein n=1 Tax=Paspalum notatum var. saurae TaxID=547442 RepID=A0AAQ3WZX0_PASNO